MQAVEDSLAATLSTSAFVCLFLKAWNHVQPSSVFNAILWL